MKTKSISNKMKETHDKMHDKMHGKSLGDYMKDKSSKMMRGKNVDKC